MMLPISRLSISDDRMINDYVADLRSLRWVGHVAQMRKVKIMYTVLVRKHEGTRQFGKPKPRCTWIGNTQVD
jgi:hypothetical protein